MIENKTYALKTYKTSFLVTMNDIPEICNGYYFKLLKVHIDSISTNLSFSLKTEVQIFSCPTSKVFKWLRTF